MGAGFPGFHGLRARLIALVLLAAVPALALILYNGFEQRRAAAADTRHEAMRMALIAAREERRLIFDTRGLLETLALVPDIGARTGDCPRLLARIRQRRPYFANLGLISGTGDVVCSALPLRTHVTVADRPYFRHALATRGFAIGDYQIGRITGKASLNLGYPVYDRTGALRFVLFAAIDLSWLQNLAAQTRLPAHWAIALIDARGTVLARYPNGARWVGHRLPYPALRQQLRGDAQGVIDEPGLDGVMRLHAFVPLADISPTARAHVCVSVPLAIAFAGATRLFWRNMALLGLLTLLLVALAPLGADIFVLRRLYRLADAARRLGTGDLSARTAIPHAGGDIGELARAFDDMAEKLESRTRKAEKDTRDIARLNRVYAMLSGINGAILRWHERGGLLAEVCRVAHEQGGFPLAWIALHDPQTTELREAARAGDEGVPTATLSQIVQRLCDASPPSTESLATRVGLCQDLATSAALEPVSGELRARGIRSVAALPLWVSNRAIGVLVLCAAEPALFDASEFKVLRELAADTSLGLEYIEKEQELHHVTRYDRLTDLPNRAVFQDRIEQALARALFHRRHVAVLVLNADRLKEINSVHGRHVGDALLRDVAARLGGLIRVGDTVARAGSAGFYVLLTDIAHSDDIVDVVQKILDTFAGPLMIQDRELFVSLRIGIAVSPGDGTEPEALIARGEAALNALDARTANAYRFYAPEINRRAVEKLELESELRHALERGELAVAYQPLVDIHTRRVVGAEALLRWHNRRLGDIPPARFIRLAEDTDLILPIGEWVLRSACEQARRWREQGLPPLQIAVNVSVGQLRQPDFAANVRRVLEETGFSATGSGLELEITETRLMENAEQAENRLNELRDLGASISIDDFGTGYSSLSYLRRLPVETLKIDIGFVREITHNTETEAIVRAIVVLAHSLNIRTVAEGIETAEQLDRLRAIGCDIAQGFLFSPAVPPERFAALVGAPVPLMPAPARGTPP